MNVEIECISKPHTRWDISHKTNDKLLLMQWNTVCGSHPLGIMNVCIKTIHSDAKTFETPKLNPNTICSLFAQIEWFELHVIQRE